MKDPRVKPVASEEQTVRVNGRNLKVSNLEKVLWPRDGYTKGDLIEYYESVAKIGRASCRERVYSNV